MGKTSSQTFIVLTVQNRCYKHLNICTYPPMNNATFAARVYVVMVAKPKDIAGDAGS